MSDKKRILITGSEGSVAGWIIGLIDLKESYEILGVDNFFRYGKIDKQRDYKLVEGDLCDKNWIDEIISIFQPHFVLHCAAQIYGVKGFHKFSADIISNNLVSTSNLAKASVDHGVEKLVYISSSMVYENSEIFPLKEEFTKSIAMPNTGYGVSKLVGEKIIQEYHQQYGLRYVIWRPFNIVTPYERSDQEPGISHVFADFIQKITIDQQHQIEIFGDGNQTRCFTWIDDIAKIIVKRSFDPITDNEIYNLGSKTPTKIIDLATKIFKKSGRKDNFIPNFLEIYQDDIKMRIPDSTKAEKIGFRTTMSIDQMIDICIRHAKLDV